MRHLFYLALLISPSSIFAQANNCVQYEKAFNYFNSDSTFKAYYKGVKLKFKVNENVCNGGIHPLLTYDYIAGKLELENENEVFNQDTSVVNSMYRKIEAEHNKDTSDNKVTCLSEFETRINAKIRVNFCRVDEDVIVAYTSRNYKKSKRTYGIIHIFFFDKNNEIKRVQQSNWIE